MGAPDAILLGLLATCDLTLFAYLRRLRARRVREQRMRRVLRLAIQREIGLKAAPANFWVLRRAS